MLTTTLFADLLVVIFGIRMTSVPARYIVLVASHCQSAHLLDANIIAPRTRRMFLFHSALSTIEIPRLPPIVLGSLALTVNLAVPNVPKDVLVGIVLLVGMAVYLAQMLSLGVLRMYALIQTNLLENEGLARPMLKRFAPMLQPTLEFVLRVAVLILLS